MNIAIDNSSAVENKIITVKFNGIIDFKVDENGMVVDGDKTISHQELYEMIAPEKEEAILEDAEILEDERISTDELPESDVWQPESEV